MRKPVVTKLGDEFGDYLLTISCRRCRHTLISEPGTLAQRVGWEITLGELATRLRCTECGSKECELTAQARARPRGWGRR
jgi:DNA-directed RNA polymerase subunit RPC12/RpoP